MVINSLDIGLEVSILSDIFFLKLYQYIFTLTAAFSAQPLRFNSRSIISTSTAFSPKYSASRPLINNLRKAIWNNRSSATVYPQAYNADLNDGAFISGMLPYPLLMLMTYP